MEKVLEVKGLTAEIVKAVDKCDTLKIGDVEFIPRKKAVKIAAELVMDMQKQVAVRLLQYINDNPHCLDYPEEDLLEYFFIHVIQ